jgi:hypothetical protein
MGKTVPVLLLTGVGLALLGGFWLARIDTLDNPRNVPLIRAGFEAYQAGLIVKPGR